MDVPNAKICPRCGKVVPLHLGVCDHCARLFRTPIEGKVADNRTMMLHHLPFPPPAPPAPPQCPPRPWWASLALRLPPMPDFRRLLARMHWHL